METNATAKVRIVTAETAIEWLSNKWGEQRAVRSTHVNRIAADMEAGRFKIGSDAILRIKGKLANGQHRLAAVAQTGIPQWFLVMESNDEELYKVLDVGLRRTVSDSLPGVEYSHDIPPIARWLMMYDSGNNRQGARSGGDRSASNGVATHVEVVEYCEKNNEILVEAASFVTKLYPTTKILPKSIGGALYVLAASNPQKLARMKEFLTAVYISGGDDVAGDLRNRLIANRVNRAKLSNAFMLLLTIKAFSYYLAGVRPGTLKLLKDEKCQRI